MNGLLTYDRRAVKITPDVLWPIVTGVGVGEDASEEVEADA